MICAKSRKVPRVFASPPFGRVAETPYSSKMNRCDPPLRLALLFCVFFLRARRVRRPSASGFCLGSARRVGRCAFCPSFSPPPSFYFSSPPRSPSSPPCAPLYRFFPPFILFRPPCPFVRPRPFRSPWPPPAPSVVSPRRAPPSSSFDSSLSSPLFLPLPPSLPSSGLGVSIPLGH